MLKVAEEQALETIKTDMLSIAYARYGPSDGWPVVLSHGFPYGIDAFGEVSTILAHAGAQVFTPYTRGFGGTRFVSKSIMRNAQQVVRGIDMIQFADALGLQMPIIGGFDWGGNASCVAAALWPEKIGGLVTYASYDVIDVQEQRRAALPTLERNCWYQHLFQSERGRECLTKYRYEIGQMLWHEWSPNWQFDEKTYAKTASAFENPDFVAIVVHCYRFMHGLNAGDPSFQHLEEVLAQKPTIKVPTVTIDGTADPLKPGGTADHASLFVGLHNHVVVDAGHNVPQENPKVFADAVMQVHRWQK